MPSVAATDPPRIGHGSTTGIGPWRGNRGRLRAPTRQNQGMIASETLREAGVSDREAEVLRLVADRATNAEIAAQLYVSVRTVESHVSSLLRKLDAPDRRALARLADD